MTMNSKRQGLLNRMPLLPYPPHPEFARRSVLNVWTAKLPRQYATRQLSGMAGLRSDGVLILLPQSATT